MKRYRKIKKRKDNAGFASSIERRNAELLERAGVEFWYEDGPCLINYTMPVTKGSCTECHGKKVVSHHKYTCDLAFISESGKLILIEIKGSPRAWNGEARTKHLRLQELFPEIDIRFVFVNQNAKIGKGAKTTNKQWCKKNEFLCASSLIPLSWIKE